MKEILCVKKQIKNIMIITNNQNIMLNFINTKKKQDNFKNIYHDQKLLNIPKKSKQNIFKKLLNQNINKMKMKKTV